MSRMTYAEVFEVISSLKSSFRSVRRETPKIKKDENLNPKEKMNKLLQIEDECVQNILNFFDSSNTKKQLILDLHQLLRNYKYGTQGRESAYAKCLLKYTNERIDELKSFMESNLFAEYEYAIKSPEFIIELEVSKYDKDGHM